MSTITHELLGVPMFLEVTVVPAVDGWQPAAGGYATGVYHLSLEEMARDEDTALLHIRLTRDDGEPFALQHLKVAFDLPIVDIHGTWTSTAIEESTPESLNSAT